MLAQQHSYPRWAVIGIFLLLLIAGLAYAQMFFMPVVLAFLLALVFSPVRRFMEKRGIPPAISAFVIVAAVVVALFAGVATLAKPASEWIERAPELAFKLENRWRDLASTAQDVIDVGEQVDELASGGQDGEVDEVVIREPGTLAKLASQAPAVLSQAAFTIVLLLFLLASGDMFYEKIVHVLPTFRDKRRAVRIAYDIQRKMSHYLFTITLINAGLGVLVGLSMWAIGMPNPLLFGVIAFVLNYVPYIGAMVGVMIAAVVGLLTFNQLEFAFLPAAVYLVLTGIEGQFVTPYFVGRRLEMNTVVVFLAVAFMAWLWSIFGMLVAVPILVMVRAFCEHIAPLEPLGHFLSARGNEALPERNGTLSESD